MIRKITILSIILCSLNLNAQSVNKDRPEAINKLMKSVGSEEAWKNAKGFYMLEIAHYGNLKLPLVRHFWIDFKKPRIKIESRSSEVNNDRALNINKGWTSKNNQTEIWEEKTVNGFLSFWPGIPTRIFHLIANNDSSLTYKINEDKIDFYVNEKFVIWIATDDKGNPVAYGRSNNHRDTHFLGEMLDYGPVRLWKEASEPGGQWKVIMVDYKLLDDLSEIDYSNP